MKLQELYDFMSHLNEEAVQVVTYATVSIHVFYVTQSFNINVFKVFFYTFFE